MMTKQDMKTARQQRSNGRDTYAALLDAALAIWSEEGIDQVTMNAVAERSGRSRGIMYHHFTKRDDLIAALHVHLNERLTHIFDFSKAPSRNDYLMVAGLMVDSPEVIRSYIARLLTGDARHDPLMDVARAHYRDIDGRGWLQPGMDVDHAAVISIAMWFASMLAVDLKVDLADRRAEAFKFASTFQAVMERAVIKAEAERAPRDRDRPS